MNIPLDNLYHWIYSLTDRPAIIYYFYPHGHKKLSNLIPIFDLPAGKVREKFSDHFNIICHDQEALNFNFYESYTIDSFLAEVGMDQNIMGQILVDYSAKNFDIFLGLRSVPIYDQTVLIHSELNSQDVAKYQSRGYVPVHYWCHGVIARDWFRFAEVDKRLRQQSTATKDFLIYARDWSGSREYRLKFLEMILEHNLDTHSRCYFDATSSSINCHYQNYQFENSEFAIVTNRLESMFQQSQATSASSADYNVEDHVQTQISVVLETQFDGSKIHLTEKICRALACAHPFLLAAGPRSLQYLKDYGFQTFEPWLDESYDHELDSVTRLKKIIDAMKKFTQLDANSKPLALTHLKNIAYQNQKRFFSGEFANQLTSELEANLSNALAQASKTRGKKYLDCRKLGRAKFGNQYLKNKYPTLRDHLTLLRHYRKG